MIESYKVDQAWGLSPGSFEQSEKLHDGLDGPDRWQILDDAQWLGTKKPFSLSLVFGLIEVLSVEKTDHAVVVVAVARHVTKVQVSIKLGVK